MTPQTRKGLVLAGSFLCLVLGFLAGKLRPEVEAVTVPAATAELAQVPPWPEPEPPAGGPVIVPLSPEILLSCLDVQHDEMPAWMRSEFGKNSEADDEPSPESVSALPAEGELSPLCPRANLLRPVPLLMETMVARQLPSDAPLPREPSEPRPWPVTNESSNRNGSAGTRSSRSEPLPYTGTYPATFLKEVNCLALPAGVREQLEEKLHVFFLRADADGCIWIGTAASLERAADRNNAARRRLLFAQTERGRLRCDGQLVIPEHLARAANLMGEVVVIGAGDHFELWETSRWRHYVDEAFTDPRRSRSLSASTTDHLPEAGTLKPDKNRYYRVTDENQRFIDVARRVLGDPLRWTEIHRLNPTWNPSVPLPIDTVLQVPPEDLPESKEPDPLDD